MPVLSINTIYRDLNLSFGKLLDPNHFEFITIVSDNSYQTVTSAEWLQSMVKTDAQLAPSKYRRDIFDCDDYVMYLKTRVSLFAANTPGNNFPYAIGFILTTLHAFNFGITDQREVFMLNTQSDNRDFLIFDNLQNARDFLSLSNQNSIKFIYI